jgi:hypothetical protein
MEHEHMLVYPIMKTHEIIAYYGYFDDIWYSQNKTNIEQTLNKFSNVQPSINFTIEKEQREKINYLDITTHRRDNKLEFLIYRKPSQTDIIILNSSCHTYEHKPSGIKYLLGQLHTYPITREQI